MQIRVVFACVAIAGGLLACKPPPIATPVVSATAVPSGKALELDGYLTAHDPVIAKDGDRFYVFTTGAHIPILCSKDMRQWEFCGRVFKDNPKWIGDAISGVTDLWAPDISFFNGKWHLYYSASTFGKNRSLIGLATNTTLNPDSPNYKWVDEGLVVESKPSDDWNAIDPNLAMDESGQPWLAFGSYWSGIKLRKLNANTGKPASDARLYNIASRPHTNGAPGAIEGAFITRRGGYYYLFASFDFCCRGTNSTYNIRVGRATTITGPYVDQAGVPMLDGGGTLVLQGSKRWKGPGHNAILKDGDTYWLVYHAYDNDVAGAPRLRIEPLSWSADGWPIAPSQSMAGST